MSSTSSAHELYAKRRPAAKARKSAIIAKCIAYNWRSKFRLALGAVESSIGATHAGKPLAESLDYIDAVYRDYVFYGNLSQEHIEGRSILELGPGDNFGVALQFLTAGAARVAALDKFFTDRDDERAAAIYRAMRERLSGASRSNFDSAVDLNGGIRFGRQRLQVIEGVGMEDAHRVFSPESFSLIVSRAVLEEVHDIDRALMALDRVLEPGGRMVHKIDLSDYGIFSRHGMHPLEFLTIPEPVYRLMTEHSGHPNRRRLDYYRARMQELGYSAELLVTSVVGEPGEILPHRTVIQEGTDYSSRSLELIREIRTHLAWPFRKLPDADLLVSGIFLVAQKPGREPAVSPE